jgi:Na+/H+-translocating membrane pyrophosphatase
VSVTTRLRTVFTCLLVATVVAAVVGWFLDKDPGKLAPVIAWITGAIMAGEASNIGKRATFNKEAVDADTEEVR